MKTTKLTDVEICQAIEDGVNALFERDAKELEKSPNSADRIFARQLRKRLNNKKTPTATSGRHDICPSCEIKKLVAETIAASKKSPFGDWVRNSVPESNCTPIPAGLIASLAEQPWADENVIQNFIQAWITEYEKQIAEGAA